MRKSEIKIYVTVLILAIGLTLLAHQTNLQVNASAQVVTFLPSEDGWLIRAQHSGEASGDPNIAYQNVWGAGVADNLYTIYSDEGAAQICRIEGGWLSFEIHRLPLFL